MAERERTDLLFLNGLLNTVESSREVLSKEPVFILTFLRDEACFTEVLEVVPNRAVALIDAIVEKAGSEYITLNEVPLVSEPLTDEVDQDL